MMSVKPGPPGPPFVELEVVVHEKCRCSDSSQLLPVQARCQIACRPSPCLPPPQRERRWDEHMAASSPPGWLNLELQWYLEADENSHKGFLERHRPDLTP